MASLLDVVKKMISRKKYRTTDVFGISTDILAESYVDRGHLDSRINKLLKRDTHIALRGESKCGKSWLRKKVLPDAITVQCRINRSVTDMYVDALSQIGLSLIQDHSSGVSDTLKLQASGEIGFKILTKLSAVLSTEIKSDSTVKYIPVGKNLEDLRFVSEIINASGRRLVIEDFHYLSQDHRSAFAHDLKALWDYKTFVVIIGIWTESNLLIHLNQDLAGRIEEISIFWSETDLGQVLTKGANALNLEFSNRIRRRLVDDSFGTVGIIQKLALSLLDEHGIEETRDDIEVLDDPMKYESVAMEYAEQLNALYQTFANRVVGGIRRRRDSTGIYAHMLKVVMAAETGTLTSGMSTDMIFVAAHAAEPRVQKGNLKQILNKINGIQVDDHGRGLIITYDPYKDEVSVVDKQLFLYRKYATARWPWENLIEEADRSDTGYDQDPND